MRIIHQNFIPILLCISNSLVMVTRGFYTYSVIGSGILCLFLSNGKRHLMSWKNMSHQIGIIGAMGAIMQDNREEFNCEEMQEVASICTSEEENPFQNVLCEIVHSLTVTMLTKLEHGYSNVIEHSLIC